MTDVKALYYKERRRAQRAIRKAQKEGYDVNVSLPKIPKKITEGSVRRLREKFSTKEINRRSTKVVEGGEVISRQQSIVRSRWQKKETPVLPPAEPLPPSEPEDGYEDDVLDELELLLDKFRRNIDYIDGLPDDDDHTQYYREGGTVHSTKDDIVKILEGYYNELSGICASKKPLPESIYNELKTLADDEFFSLDHYGYEETEVADPLCAKMVQLANQLDDKDLETKASELADGDEYVEVSPEFMEQYGWMFNM